MPQDALVRPHTPEVSRGVCSLDMMKDVDVSLCGPYRDRQLRALPDVAALRGVLQCAKVQMRRSGQSLVS